MASNGIVLNRAEFRDRVLGCFLGKNIGGTIGAPMEGKKYCFNLSSFEPMPTEPTPNDDLDLQLVWLAMVERYGLPPRLSQFAQFWRDYLKAYPWDEYGFCERNLGRGLRPPVSGWFENSYIDNMGSPIRSEIWACLAPAQPQLAAEWAWNDAVLDHAGGEGVWGEMFWAAVQSAAFVESDVPTLLEIGLNMIPPSSRIYRVIREAMWCLAQKKSWGEARERIVQFFGHFHPCHAVANHGFTVLGWLYGSDFGDRMCKAVNCGYDTDCTGATLGATMGILMGAKAIPAEWSDPVGRSIVLHNFTKSSGFTAAPATLEELTDRVCKLTEDRANAGQASFTFGQAGTLPGDLRSRLFANDLAVAAAARDVNYGVEEVDGHELALHYRGEPVLRPHLAKTMHASLDGAILDASRVTVTAPAGVKVEWTGDDRFTVSAANVNADVKLTLQTAAGGKMLAAEFLLLCPASAAGYPTMQNVPRCPKCQCRVEGCVCTEPS